VSAGAALDGRGGRINGNVMLASGSKLNSGTMTIGGLGGTGTINFNLANHDLLNVQGSVDLSKVQLLLDFTNSNVGAGYSFMFLSSSQAVLGGFSFSTLGLADGLMASISENVAQNGLSVTLALAPVPEPETYAMLLAGLGLLGFMARRRKTAEAGLGDQA
jgi:hypothetical protein